MGLEKLLKSYPAYHKEIRWKVGDGKTIKFSTDAMTKICSLFDRVGYY